MDNQNKTEKKKTNVFISWSNDDNGFGKQAAETIYRFLYDNFAKDNGENLSVYYSPMSSGIWVSELFSALKQGDFGIFIVTPELLDSTWCAVEFGAILVNNLKSHIIEEKEVIDFGGIGEFILPVCFYAGIDKTNSPFKEDQIKKYDTLDEDGHTVIHAFLTKIVQSAFEYDSRKLSKMITRLVEKCAKLNKNLDDLTNKYKDKSKYTRNYRLRQDESTAKHALEEAQTEIEKFRHDLSKNNTPEVDELRDKIAKLEAENANLSASLDEARSELKKQVQPFTETSDTFEIVVDGKTYGNMVYVKGGTFAMGAEYSEASDDEKPVHEVSVSDFLICDVPVTQGLWYAVMKSNPSYFTYGDDYPVECVTWYDAVNFCNELSKNLGFSRAYKIRVLEMCEDINGKGEKYQYIKNALVKILPGKNGFRLPTEAEWEYAARGGHKTDRKTKSEIIYSGDHNGQLRYLSELAWYGYSDDKDPYRTIKEYTTMPVGYQHPNELGLYDMTGNVWEWCQDLYEASGASRVLRGGSWGNNAGVCRVSYRDFVAPGGRNDGRGFRLLLSSPKKEEK